MEGNSKFGFRVKAFGKAEQTSADREGLTEDKNLKSSTWTSHMFPADLLDGETSFYVHDNMNYDEQSGSHTEESCTNYQARWWQNHDVEQIIQ